MSKVHIGDLITEKVREIGITKAELARRTNMSRQNVNSILKKPSLDTALLSRISKALHCNLFSAYENELKGLDTVGLDEQRVRDWIREELRRMLGRL